MNVVIDIDEETYNYIKNKDDIESNILISDIVKMRERIVDTLIQSVISSTPLPKGHGRLGDLDALEKEIENYSKGAFAMAPEFLVKNAPTIIEADKAENEDKA